ncbi:hypothetical protein QJS10_CPB12g00393 [Acorus calamus]|uniref:Uncharacterized protein n=1 Tax=Acorus calamus TaxID=4465 RepID=A0AAV9DN73_ACOCL|nr:hypothetical protein QJS10_CPB12g00393 [Acorus calamus]
MATPELYEVPPAEPLPLKSQSLHIFRCTTPPDRKAALPEIEGEGESQRWNLRTRRLRIGSQTQSWVFQDLWLTEVTTEETYRVP